MVLVAAAVVASGSGGAFATCTLRLGGFAMFQCANVAYFDTAPFPVALDANARPTNVTAVFWQIGYGNATVNNGSGSSGTGIGSGGAFNGNDSGLFHVDLEDARQATGYSYGYFPNVPAGALCLVSDNNWGNPLIDGCADNPRDAALPFSQDGLLNTNYDVNLVRSYGYAPASVPSEQWVQDSPIMLLLREPTSSYLAVAAVSSFNRASNNFFQEGYYDFTGVNDGLLNPTFGGHNIVPWQGVPGKKSASDPVGLVRSITPVSPGRNSDRILNLGWTDVTVFSDNASRPSTNATVATGMGTAEAGPLVRYVVETQPIVDPKNPIGTLDPSKWTSAGTFLNPINSTTLRVPHDTCVRLHTFFGKAPVTATPSIAACRLGECGDLGYDVASPATCVGGKAPK
jgi:hypothetical protein